MRLRPLTWFLLSLALFGGALVCWQWAERRQADSPRSVALRHGGHGAVRDVTPRGPAEPAAWRLLSRATDVHTRPVAPAAAPPAARDYRLSNARLTPAQWLRRPTALLLENALLDTAVPAPLPIPDHLRAPPDAGTFIVQARGPLDDRFRARVAAAGGRIIAYIPNNAYLVRISSAGARQLTPHAQAVVPFEPYFKLKPDLLALAVADAPLPPDAQLNVALFADAREATLAALQALGATVLAEEPSPFGPVVTVRPQPATLTALARLPGVQLVETAGVRLAANDLGRVRLGVAPDPLAPSNHLGLTGANVLINVNDSGVDATHPDLAGRMLALTPAALVDTNGHGTHVIGSIAGNGAMSATVSNASGSVAGADFRGKAPAAQVFVLPVGLVNRPGVAAGSPALPDSALQELAARTNAFISNNSWHYSGANGYDLAAARYDAATRDALPAQPGCQPLLFVFAAGNAGAGNNSGTSGDAETVRSPGTAKNVITVGAIEQTRDITNEVVVAGVTNQPFQPQTDSDNEVAAFSSRGNVGLGLEGETGRFKPDVVAPGQWVISTRSAQWDEAAYFNPTNAHPNLFADQVALPGEWNNYSIYVPFHAVQVLLEVLPNAASPTPFPGLPIFVRQADIPTTNAFDFVRTNRVSLPPDNGPTLTPREATWFFSVANPTAEPVSFDLLTVLVTTNDNGNEFEVRSNLNRTLGPYYRYESGSSMAAAHVSGTLALMQEFFAQRLGRTNSPALMKALLINGARPLGTPYDLRTRGSINYQGWGLVNLPATLPASLETLNSQTSGSRFLLDQSPTNALVTGQRHTFKLTLSDAARTQPLRVTLAWTDPPGNPAAGVKLVNDLDLVVTNLDTGEVYWGNDIPAGSDFSQVWNTNTGPNADLVNNVENVYLPSILSTNYTVTVVGSRVNVNAVTAHPDNVAQDYALVIASGDGGLDNTMTLTALPAPAAPALNLQVVTNTFDSPEYAGAILLGQHVGANTPLLGTTNGITNQWHFYVLTNTTRFTNAAFITFLPPTLALPPLGVREEDLDNATRLEADIDLYVTTNPGLTNLDPAAVAGADKSRLRGGTEVIVYSNAVAGGVYYVGVKAEDQMAAEYGFLGVFSLFPFTDNDNGNLVLRGFPVPAAVPDGSPDDPGNVQVFAIATWPVTVRRVIVTNWLTHQRFGDLVGNLSHGRRFAVLNNHSVPPGSPPPVSYRFVYEDNGEGDIPDAQRSDGPGSLRDFVGEEGVGLWLLTLLDNALTQTGRVDDLRIRLEPQNLSSNGVLRTLQPGGWAYDVIDVPAEATNLTVCVSGNTQPVELYLRRDAFPTRTEYDAALTVNPPGGCLSLSRADLPPLTTGRYFIGVFNPSSVPQTIRIWATLGLDLAAVAPVTFTAAQPVPLPDDAVTYDTITVPLDRQIAQIEVGVRVDHPRVSDLVFHLISPSGTRVLLAENRGGLSDAGIGSTLVLTNIIPVSTNGGPATTTNQIDTGATSGTLTIDYDFFPIPDQMTVYYEGVRLFDSGMVSGPGRVTLTYGPGTSTEVMIIMNEFGNANPATRWEYTVTAVQTIHSYLIFTENTNAATLPVKFLPPPFANTNLVAPSLISGFEVAVGNYSAPATVDGWTVASNQVSVLHDPSLAHSGSRLLALADGQLTRSLPTVAGRPYALQFAYRGPAVVSWWPADGSGADAVDANVGTMVNGATFTTGLVGGQAFLLDGLDDRVLLGDPDNLKFTGAFTLESWVFAHARPANLGFIFLRADSRFCLDPYYLAMLPSGGIRLHVEDESGSPPCGVQLDSAPIPLGEWTHLAGVFDAAAGTLLLYTNGSLAAQTSTTLRPFRDLDPLANPAVAIGNDTDLANAAGFNGRIDELSVYARALSGAEVQAIYRRGAAGKYDPGAPAPENLARAALELGGAGSMVFYGDNTTWQTRAITFLATSSGTSVQLTGLQPGMLLDSFTLAEPPGPLYVLPEETLEALTGESALGTWRLEVLDNRQGATNPAPVLLSWQLRFRFQETVVVPTFLVHGLPRTNTIPAGGLGWYAVDVPAWAQYATNRLLSATAPVSLWFNQYTPPTGTNAGDVLLIGPATSGSATLSTAGTPPLLPGQRYYLGVQNTNPLPVTVVLQVDFDITPLTNGVPLTSVLAPGALPRYFSYEVSTNAAAVSFQLYALSGDVNLVARRGPPLPTVDSFDHGSFNPGTHDEEILLFTNSLPVGLSPGLWYLGVFNADSAPVSYTILATEYTNLLPTIITLANAIPYHNVNPGPLGAADYYRYRVTPAAGRAQFEINGPDADLTLVARKGFPPLPDLVNFDYLSANAYTNDELIVVFTNSAPVPLAPGDWFLAAVNVSGGPVRYAIRATEWTATGQPILLTQAARQDDNFCLSWASLPGAHYYVQGLTDLHSTNWVTLSPTLTATDDTTTWCLPLPSPFRFFRVVEGLALSTYLPPPAINRISRQPAGVLLEWQAPATATFRVDWSATLAPPSWNSFTNLLTSTNGQFRFLDDGSQTGGPAAARFYRLVQLP